LNFIYYNLQDIDEHLFKGPQTKCKENDYLLVFDSETREFVLEKHSSSFALRNIRPTKRRKPESGEEDTPTTGRILMPITKAVEDDGDEFSDLESDLLRDLEKS
jgi:hypothetical protein